MHWMRCPLFALMLPLCAASAGETDENWDALYKSGKLHTRFQHYVTMADGIASRTDEENGMRPGHAVLSMKVWARSSDDAAQMARVFAGHAGFKLLGPIEIYKTGRVTSPPRGEQYGYAIKFYPYDPNKKD